MDSDEFEERRRSGGDGLDLLRWQVNELRRWRREDIDKLDLPVMAYELKQMKDEVKAMKRALYTFAFAVTLAAITFAFSVLALIHA